MRALSREIFVGFLLVFGLVVSGCQQVQPLSVAAEGGSLVESEPITDSVAIAEATNSVMTVTVTETTMLTDTGVITGMPVAMVNVGVNVGVNVEATVEMTATEAVTPTALSPVATSEVTADPDLLAAGLAVYRAQYCGVCHLLDAAETRGTFGPIHNGMGATAAARIQEAAYGGSATTADKYIRESIVEPQAFLVSGFATTPHRMPSYAFLDVDSLDALVAFLLVQ